MTGANIDRNQIWQASRITKNNCRYWIHHPHFVQSTKFHQNETSAVLCPKLWPERWQVPTLAGVKNLRKLYCHQWIHHLQIVHCAKFHGKWLTSFPVPRSPFPVPLFKDNHKKSALKTFSVFIGKYLQHNCFLVNIKKFLRTPILKNICDRLSHVRISCL